MSGNGKTLAFAYDENGQRVRKSVTENGVTTTTEYTVDGKNVVHLVRGNDKLHFFYEGSKPSHCKYNNSVYTYVYSLQGDVLGLKDTSGTFVVGYRYDAWGKEVSRTGSLANTLGSLNPFRYRGYVYDEETGLYYLRSRYYNAEVGRFISSDCILGEVGGLLQHNLFCYCGNGHTNKIDKNGYSSDWYNCATNNETLVCAFSLLPLITMLKSVSGGSIAALRTLDYYSEAISEFADEFDLEIAELQAILFREMICVGVDDLAADLRFVFFGKDCSTGIGQIKAQTAINAEVAIMGGCGMTMDEMWYTLQNPCENIKYVAMNLASIKKNNDINGENLEMYNERYLMFARYNSTTLNDNAVRYADAVMEYYNAFCEIMEGK